MGSETQSLAQAGHGNVTESIAARGVQEDMQIETFDLMIFLPT